MASLATGQFLAQFAGLPGEITAQGPGVATIHSAGGRDFGVSESRFPVSVVESEL